LPRRLVAFALLSLVAAGAGPAQGAQGEEGVPPGRSIVDQRFDLTADELEYDAARDIYTASGNVVIFQGDPDRPWQEQRSLSADWVSFNAETGSGVASGHVVLVDRGDVLRADFIEFNVHTFEGVVYDGRLDSDRSPIVAAGGRIEKTGEQTYRLEDAVFTSCRCEDEEARRPWQVSAGESEVEVEGYGTSKNTTVDILGVPLLWFPWMIYPVKTERQSGVLFPDLALGGVNGVEVGLPLFWAARDDLNVTTTPRWTSKRGFKIDTDFETVLGQESWGDLGASYAYDLYIHPNSNENPFGRNRWSVRAPGDLHLPADVQIKSDLRFASDNEYALDFENLRLSRADRYLEAALFVGGAQGPAGRFGVGAAATYYDDMQSPDNQDRDPFAMQRLPDVFLDVLPAPFLGLSFVQPSMNVDYTWFQTTGSALAARGSSRDAGVFLDTGVDSLPDGQEQGIPGFVGDPDANQDDANLGGTENDGLFEEGEPLTDEGQRLWLHPRLAAPVRLGRYAELYPEIGWHQTLYGSDLLGFAQRGFFTARADLRTRFERRFGADTLHVLEPLVGYALTTAHSQSGNPLFVPATALPQVRLRTLDLDNITRDTADRVPRTNLVTFGFANRVRGRAGLWQEPEGVRQIADFTLIGGYDFEISRWAPVVLDGRAWPRRDTEMGLSVGFDPQDVALDLLLASATWRHPRGHSLSVGYSYRRDIQNLFEDFRVSDAERWRNFEDIGRLNQLNGSIAVWLTRSWLARYRFAYSFDRNLRLANAGAIEYLSRCNCWRLGVEVTESRARGVRFQVLYSIVGLGQDERPQGPGLLDALGGV
jgi:hypothetical protein